MVSPSADRPTRTPTPAITTRSRGKPMVPRRKARRRANRRYSYRATRSALCIPARALLLLRHHVHKYILERSFSQLKPVQANIFPARQFTENQLGIPARRLLFLQNLLDQPSVDRVQTGEGLVHDDEVRLVQQCGDNLRLLLHALGELLNLLIPMLPEVQALQPVRQTLPGISRIQPLQGSQVHQDGLQAGILVETTILREIADAVLALSGERTAQHFRPSPIRREDVQHHA